MATSARGIEIENQNGRETLIQARGGIPTCGVRAIAVMAFAGVMLVSMVAFSVGKFSSSQMMLFMVPAPPRAMQAPTVSVKEIMTGMQPVRDRIGIPVAQAEANQQIMSAMRQYDKCDTYCCRRDMLKSGVAAAALTLGAPALAAVTKEVLAGGDGSPVLVFVPDTTKICKGDSVVWKANKGLPHNVIFDEDNVPEGVEASDISQQGNLAKEGDTFQQTFNVAGTYGYFCAPHRGAGMVATVEVMA